MRELRIYVRAVRWLAILAVPLAMVATSARADEPLRWKFQDGQQISYRIVQEMTISGAGAAAELGNTSWQQLDITWDVQSVNDAGDAVIQHRFDRIRSKMTLPVGRLEFDSADEGLPSGMAAINAPFYTALVEHPIEITVTARGQLKSVKLPEGVLEALKRVPAAEAMGEVAKPEKFQALFLPGFPTLPEGPLEPGQQWSTKQTTEIPSAGEQTLQRSYRYEGTRQVEDVTLAVIQPSRTLSFAEQGENRRAVQEQASEGEILFNPAAGRLYSTKLIYRATIGTTLGQRRAEQKIEQKIDLDLVPPN